MQKCELYVGEVCHLNMQLLDLRDGNIIIPFSFALQRKSNSRKQKPKHYINSLFIILFDLVNLPFHKL